MGLAEKRAIQDLTTTKFPQWQKQVQEAAGFPLVLEFKWDTLAVADYAHMYSDWETVFITPLVATLRSICADQMGKDALKAKFNKVVCQNTIACHYGEGAISFEGSTIVLDHEFSNVDYHFERSKAWTEALEKNL